MSVPVAHGTPQSTLDDVVVIPFNDVSRALQILDENAGELACILLDLVPHRIGLTPADKAYVTAIDRWAKENDVLLVCDEVITFRCQYQGAQKDYGIDPDLTALGKMIGGGFPVGALAGSREVMSVMDPHTRPVLFPHSGTFSANPVTMTAGLTALRLFDHEAVVRLNELGHKARVQLTDAIRIADVPACVTGAGSMFRILMKPAPPRNYRSGYPSAAESTDAAEFS